MVVDKAKLGEPILAADLEVEGDLPPLPEPPLSKAEYTPPPKRPRGRPTKEEASKRKVYESNQRAKVRASDKKRREAVEGFVPGAPPWTEGYPLAMGARRGQGKKLTPGEAATLRYAAGLHFVTDLNGVTTAEMAKMPQFALIPTRTLNEWCEEDKWVERRHQNLDRWRGAIESRIGDSLVQKQVEDLTKLSQLFDQALKMTMPDEQGHLKVVANSWEGVANVAARLGKAIGDMRQGLVKSLTPTQAAAQKDSNLPTSKPVLSPHDARDMAHMVLARRGRAVVDADPDSVEEVEAPKKPDGE